MRKETNNESTFFLFAYSSGGFSPAGNLEPFVLHRRSGPTAHPAAIDRNPAATGIGDEERRMNETAQRAREGDAALNEARWEGEGRGVGTGRRRQGSSDEPDRHANPKLELKDRWQGTDDALRNAADDVEGMAERRTPRGKRAARGDRTGGASVAPTGVPKADHVAEPLDADRQAARVDTTRDTGGAHIERGDLT